MKALIEGGVSVRKRGGGILGCFCFREVVLVQNLADGKPTPSDCSLNKGGCYG